MAFVKASLNPPEPNARRKPAAKAYPRMTGQRTGGPWLVALTSITVVSNRTHAPMQPFASDRSVANWEVMIEHVIGPAAVGGQRQNQQSPPLAGFCSGGPWKKGSGQLF